nr:uncharacterized protein LOC127312645 isoform X1 [Lolium perenne]
MRLLHLLPWKLWLLCFSSPLACSPFVLSTSRTMATRRTDRQFGEHEEMKYLIAVATGQAHDHFPVNDVVQMLMFTSDQQFLKYISVSCCGQRMASSSHRCSPATAERKPKRDPVLHIVLNTTKKFSCQCLGSQGQLSYSSCS